MSEMAQVEALRREIRADRMVSIRFWLLAIVWGLTLWLPEYKSIFNSMNVELPAVTKLMLATSDILEDWWFLILPAGWVVWRMFEDRFLANATNRRLRFVSYMMAALALAGLWAMQSPWNKLINNVG